MEKIRLDIYLTDNGHAPSREKAKAIIMSGQVYVDGQKSDKAGAMVPVDANIEVRGKTLKYVSRGGLKLEKAIKEFELDLKDFVCMDIGASTGGFTDCMLQNGASGVYAVDVGYGQLAWSLRTDERVINMERTNIRYIEQSEIDPLDFISVDVSFISLKLVLPVAYSLLKEGGRSVCLIKPQFEAGRENVGKKGVVRDPAVHVQVCSSIIDFCKQSDFGIRGLSYSPVRGPEGNIEYLLLIEKGGENMEVNVDSIVKQSHALD